MKSKIKILNHAKGIINKTNNYVIAGLILISTALTMQYTGAVFKTQKINRCSEQIQKTIKNRKLLPAFAFDSQHFTTYRKNTSALDYIVRIGKSVMNTKNYGPAIMLNGLTNTGEWYQFGIMYKFPEGIKCRKHDYFLRSGFGVFLEIWNKNGKLIFNDTYKFKDNISKNDIFEIQMHIIPDTVIMKLDDLTHGQTIEINIGNENAKKFKGLKQSSNINGYMTGLMIEKYSVNGSIAQNMIREQLYESANLDLANGKKKNEVAFINVLDKVKEPEHSDLFNASPSNSMIKGMFMNSLYFKKVNKKIENKHIYIKYARILRQENKTKQNVNTIANETIQRRINKF